MGGTGMETAAIMEAVKTALNCATQLSIEKEREITERQRIRAQAEVCIEKIRADLARDIHKIDMDHMVRMTMINQVCGCINTNLSEEGFYICKQLLEILKIDAANRRELPKNEYELPMKFSI